MEGLCSSSALIGPSRAMSKHSMHPPLSGIEHFPCGNEGYDPEHPTERTTGPAPHKKTPTSTIHVERRESVKAGRVAPLRGVELGFTNGSNSWWNLDEKTSVPPSMNTPLGSVLPADLRRHLPSRGPLHNLHQHFRHVWRPRRVQPL